MNFKKIFEVRPTLDDLTPEMYIGYFDPAEHSDIEQGPSDKQSDYSENTRTWD